MYYYYWILLDFILIICNAIIIKKYKYELQFQKWYELYFIIHRIMIAIPCVLLAWAGYIYIYDYFNSSLYYERVYIRQLAILVYYFVPIFGLLYVGSSNRFFYAILKCILTAVNLYQAYFIYIHRSLLTAFDIDRNVFIHGEALGIIILVSFIILDLLNSYYFISFYKINTLESR